MLATSYSFAKKLSGCRALFRESKSRAAQRLFYLKKVKPKSKEVA
jgi:hypothetical protein